METATRAGAAALEAVVSPAACRNKKDDRERKENQTVAPEGHLTQVSPQEVNTCQMPPQNGYSKFSAFDAVPSGPACSPVGILLLYMWLGSG